MNIKRWKENFIIFRIINKVMYLLSSQRDFIFFTLVCNVNLVRFSESRSPDTTDRRCVAGHKEIGVTWKHTARCSFSGSTAIFEDRPRSPSGQCYAIERNNIDTKSGETALICHRRSPILLIELDRCSFRSNYYVSTIFSTEL